VFRAVATNDAGTDFRIDPPRPLFEGRAPSVIHHRTRGYLVVFADDAGLLRGSSPDGITFSVDTRRFIGGADEPSLIQMQDDTVALYYTEDDGAGGRRVARALSADALGFGDGQPVLTPAAVADPVLWRDVDRIASPFAEEQLDADGSPFVRLWFAARGSESAASIQFDRVVPTPPNFSIGEAASTDGAAFVPYRFNPVFDRVTDFLTHNAELDPAVVSWHDVELLFYRRASPDAARSDGLAVARNPARPR
jgi:hypothetical protein